MNADQGISIRNGKRPAPCTEPCAMIIFGGSGDLTLFDRADTVESAWRLVQPILDAWAADGSRSIPTYKAGTWGPPEAGALLARDDRCWWLT